MLRCDDPYTSNGSLWIGLHENKRRPVVRSSIVGWVVRKGHNSLRCVWGDTVNLASRMESISEPGQIQVSEAAFWRLHEKYELAPRGPIEVKGVGAVETFFQMGRKAADIITEVPELPAANVNPTSTGAAEARSPSRKPRRRRRRVSQ